MGYEGYERCITNTPHLQFILESETEKTMVYSVRTSHIYDSEKSKLGVIKWYGSWRKYVYYPLPDTLYDDRCMTQIIMFMDLCKRGWKAGNKGMTEEKKVCTLCWVKGGFQDNCPECDGTGMVIK